MPTKYPTLVHEWFEEVWNQGNAQAVDRLLGEDAIVHGLSDGSSGELRGPKAFKEFHRMYLDAFPGLKVEVADTVTEGDKIVGRCIVRARHLGDGIGIKATQKEATFTGLCLAHVKDGKIVEAWNNFDFLAMHAQLGTLDSLAR